MSVAAGPRLLLVVCLTGYSTPASPLGRRRNAAQHDGALGDVIRWFAASQPRLLPALLQQVSASGRGGDCLQGLAVVGGGAEVAQRWAEQHDADFTADCFAVLYRRLITRPDTA